MKKISLALIALCSYQDMGMSALRTVLKDSRKDVDVVYLKEFLPNRQNYPTQTEVGLLIGLLKKNGANLIGLSLKSPHLPMAKMLASRIKNDLPEALLVIGGPHATLCPEECIEFSDAVCIGEGEFPLLDLVKNLESGQPINQIANLWVKENGKVHKNELRPLISDLDTLPLPDLSKDNIYYIDRDSVSTSINYPLYTTLTARGCPFSCAFCSTAALRKTFEGKGRYVRQRGIANVIAELKKVKKELPEVNAIQFNDDVFGLDTKWSLEFCEIYKEEIGLPFQIIIHPQYVSEELTRALAQTRLLKTVQVGIQSGSARVAKEIFNRTTTKPQILEAAKRFKKYRIIANYHLILDNPFSTQEDERETLDFMLSFPRPFTLSLYSLVYFPKTRIAEEALMKGVIKEEDIEGRSVKCLSQIYISPEYKRDNRQKFYINLLYLTQINFIPRVIIRIFSRISLLQNRPWLLEGFNYFIDAIDRFAHRVCPLAIRGAGHLFSGRLSPSKLFSGLRSLQVIVKDKQNF